jgi:hypothetical protein
VLAACREQRLVPDAVTLRDLTECAIYLDKSKACWFFVMSGVSVAQYVHPVPDLISAQRAGVVATAIASQLFAIPSRLSNRSARSHSPSE